MRSHEFVAQARWRGVFPSMVVSSAACCSTSRMQTFSMRLTSLRRRVRSIPGKGRSFPFCISEDNLSQPANNGVRPCSSVTSRRHPMRKISWKRGMSPVVAARCSQLLLFTRYGAPGRTRWFGVCTEPCQSG
jgi:hypothetical protein